MPATSPYTPNDYSAVSNLRPYQLPVNDIFKAISAQNAFWDAGAARVKAVYDNALNLKLSLEPNKQLRKKYIEDAEKQLAKLSSMDLSDPSVQKKGFAIFKPLFQDEGIIYDDLTTRHYEKVRNDALMYRQRDNGKGYSDINFQYAMQGYNEFINSTDRMAGKDFYQNRKEYTPYYDYTEDFSKSLKDCKPSSIEAVSPSYGTGNSMTGYFKETYSKVLSSAQVKGCLEAGLSPNAKRQLQIEGVVGYRNNLPVLAADTANYLSGVATNLSTQLQTVSGMKSGISNNPDMSAQDKQAALLSIDNQMKLIQEELDRTNHSVSKINAGDFTDIQNNFDDYAGSVYSYKRLYKKALASAFEESRQNYKADPVQLSAIRFEQDKTLRAMDFQFDISLEQMKQNFDREMKLMDLMYGGTSKSGDPFKGSDIYRNPLTGQVTVNPNLMRETGQLSDEDKPEINKKIYEELNEQVSSLNEEDQINNLTLYNNMISRGERDISFRETLLKGFNHGITEDEWTRFKTGNRNNRFSNIGGDPNKIGGIQETSWFKAYISQNPKDEDINRWSRNHTNINTGIEVLNRKIEIAENQVAKELGGDFQTQIQDSLRNIKPVLSNNGIQVSASDMQTLIEGRPIKGMSIVTEPIEVDYNRGIITKQQTTVKVNGQTDGVLTNFYRTIKGKNELINDKLRKKRIEVYNQLGFDREPWYFTSDEGKSRFSETLKSILPKDDKGKDLNVRVISSDFSGGVKVSIPGVEKGDDQNDIIKAIRNKGVGTSAEATGDNEVTIRGTNYNLVPQAIQNPILAQAAYQMATIGETTSFAQTQPGAKVQNADIQIPVLVSGKMQKLTVETYKIDGRPEYRVYAEGSGDPRPKVIASNAYELFEKLGNLPLDFNKPIR